MDGLLPTTDRAVPSAAHAHARAFSRTPAPTDACSTEVMPLAAIFIYLSVHRRSFVDDLWRVVCARHGCLSLHAHPPACGQKPPQLPKRVWPREEKKPRAVLINNLLPQCVPGSRFVCAVCSRRATPGVCYYMLHAVLAPAKHQDGVTQSLRLTSSKTELPTETFLGFP
jgi:hypothetical protein